MPRPLHWRVCWTAAHVHQLSLLRHGPGRADSISKCRYWFVFVCTWRHRQYSWQQPKSSLHQPEQAKWFHRSNYISCSKAHRRFSYGFQRHYNDFMTENTIAHQRNLEVVTQRNGRECWVENCASLTMVWQMREGRMPAAPWLCGRVKTLHYELPMEKKVPWNGAVSMRSRAGSWETLSICITLRHNQGAPADMHANALGILIICRFPLA